MLARFATGIDQQQAGRIECGRRGETVQHFSVHRHDRREGNHAATCRSNAVERAGNGGFGHAGLHSHAHCRGVHLITYGGSAIQFGNFFVALDVAQRHHGANEFETRGIAHLQGVQTGEVGHFDHDVVAIGRKEVHAASQTARFAEDHREFALRRRAFDATLCGHVGNRGNRARPNDIIDVNIVAHQRFDAAFAIDHQRQSVTVLAGEIKERTVLTKFVGIVREIARAVVVAGDENDAATDELAQAAAALCISGTGKEHRTQIFSNYCSGKVTTFRAESYTFAQLL